MGTRAKKQAEVEEVDERTPSALFEGMDKPELELVGQDGNAFTVMGLARRAARRAGWTKEMIDEYMGKAMAGDYDHLLQVTMLYFNVN